jgi:hypothetical protein
MMKETPQSFEPKTFQTTRPIATPKISECVKPKPGQPRWNWAGSLAFRSHGPRWIP